MYYLVLARATAGNVSSNASCLSISLLMAFAVYVLLTTLVIARLS